VKADPSSTERYAPDGSNPVGLSRSGEDRMTVPWKRLRWAIAQCLLLWRFYPPPPARAATWHRSCLARC